MKAARPALHPLLRTYLRFRAGRRLHLASSGLDFWRCHEFSCLLRWTEDLTPGVVLDVGGGGSLLGSFLEKIWGCRCLLLDLDPKLVRRFRPSWGAVQNAIHLGVATGCADLAVVTSLVHILPDDGDARAMWEVGRALAPGGFCFVSTTWSQHYAETAPETNPWGLAERWYDAAALEERIVRPSGLARVREEFFGDAESKETADAWYGSWLYRRRWARRLVGWRQVRLAATAEERDRRDPSDACNVCLLLQRPPDVAAPTAGAME
jgi:SAM-dependent methyltransferase